MKTHIVEMERLSRLVMDINAPWRAADVSALYMMVDELCLIQKIPNLDGPRY